MSKIQLNRLPDATPEYKPEQINQIIKNLEQMVFQLNTNYTQEVEDKIIQTGWFFSA